MTAILGIIHLDDGHINEELKRRLRHAITPFGRDRVNGLDWGQGHFIHALLRTTPEDSLDMQPRAHEDSHQLLLFDGRLDNRPELASQLGIDAASLCTMADSDIALRAVLRWGSDTPKYLVGDFALACWQPAGCRLWLARDALGMRPLYWTIRDRCLAFSSSARSLLLLSGTTSGPDHNRLHAHLSGLPQHGPESFFAGISRVEPGHIVTFIDGQLTTNQRHENFDDIKPLHLARDEDYVEALDALLTRITQDHLRSCTPVSSRLSSGFDSSTVTDYAARALAGRNQRLTAYTAIPRPGYDTPLPQGLHADESVAASKLVARHANIDHALVDVQHLDWLAETRQAAFTMDLPPLNSCNGLWLNEIDRRAVAAGSRVLLTGQMGNMTISYLGHELFSELIGGWRWLDWWREFQHWKHRGQWKTPIRHGLLPHLPDKLQLALRRLRHPHTHRLAPLPSALSPAFRAQLNTDARTRAAQWNAHDLPWTNSRLRRIAYLRRHDRGPYLLQANAHGLEWRDPTADVRLIHFCLSVPSSQYLRNGQTRWLLQRLIRNRLPPDITQARTKGLQQADWHEHLDRSLPATHELLRHFRSQAAVSQIIDLDSLQKWLHEWPDGGWNRPEMLQRYRSTLMRGISHALFIDSITAESPNIVHS